MRALSHGCLAVLVVLWGGCIESNPQPSPGKPDIQEGRQDTTLSNGDGVSADLARPEDVKASDTVVDAADVPCDQVTCDVDARLDLMDAGDVPELVDARDWVELSDVEVAPAGCCELGSDTCGEGMVCAFVSGEEKWGKCKPVLGLGECWTYADCDLSYEYCSGASIQSCLSVLGIVDVPGHCVHDDPPMCCSTDEQCLDGQVCVPFGDGDGTCQEKVKPGSCWRDEDCYDTQTCEGVATCGCKGMCPMGTTPGSCLPLPEGCCYGDEECPLGQVCRAVPTAGGMLPGACVADPAGPECMGDIACCWDDGDCFGGTCQGASVCGCIELCWVCGACAPNQMGTCH